MTTPNFFLAGVQKGGTSTFHLWLGQHPDVFLTSRKEIHFFCSCPDIALKVAASPSDYLRYFQSAPSSSAVVGESSPCYLYYPEAISAIVGTFEDVRFLVTLRDPVERFWSHYLMNEIYRPTGLDVDAVIDANLDGSTGANALDDLVGVGMYGRQIDQLFNSVDRDLVHITFLEHMAVEPRQVVADVLDFLKLDSHAIDTAVRDKLYVEPRNALGRVFLRNPHVRTLGVSVVPAGVRRFLRTRWFGDPNLKPALPESTRQRLRDLYRQDSRDLEEILNLRLPWHWHRGRT